MKTIIKAALATTAFASAFAAAPAFADDAPAIKFTGSATLATDYNLRGISQSNATPAIQGGITATSSTGIYVSTWASSLAGNGSWGGSNMELDLIAGYSHAVGPATLDGGVVYYVYPGTSGHEYFELYGSVSGKVGPVNAKLGTYWAPGQKNINATGKKNGHNIWVYTDLGLPISGTPITLKGHVGYSDGNSIYTWGKGVVDFGVGADLTYGPVTLNVSYVGTDLPRAFANANYGAGSKPGYSLTRDRVVATLTASF